MNKFYLIPILCQNSSLMTKKHKLLEFAPSDITVKGEEGEGM